MEINSPEHLLLSSIMQIQNIKLHILIASHGNVCKNQANRIVDSNHLNMFTFVTKGKLRLRHPSPPFDYFRQPIFKHCFLCIVLLKHFNEYTHTIPWSISNNFISYLRLSKRILFKLAYHPVWHDFFFQIFLNFNNSTNPNSVPKQTTNRFPPYLLPTFLSR